MTDAELRRLALAFRRGILGKCPSNGMCFAVSYPLQGYLRAVGVESAVEQVDFGFVNHVWLRLSDGRILDATADQFSGTHGKLPRVYLGDLPGIYRAWIARARVKAAKELTRA